MTLRWYYEMRAEEKQALIEQLEKQGRYRRKMLKKLGIPESTYYSWRRLFEAGGLASLEKQKTLTRNIWNRLTSEEEGIVLKYARLHPELSSRLIAVKITDVEEFSVSESTVYRILKENHLIAPRPLPEWPAAKEWHKKTTRPNEIWQIDGTFFFISGWGYYKLIPILDDYSRKIIAWALMPDETAQSVSCVVEDAIEKAGIKELPPEKKPKLLSDNGPGFIAELLSVQLSAHGIHHIFGKPYHPQTQGKIERFNRRIKEGVCFLVYCSPSALKRAIDEAIETYNDTPHEALSNVSPNDVYAGRKDAILQRRAEKKRWTLARRKIVNLELGGIHRPTANVLQLTEQQVGETSIPPVENGKMEDKKDQ